MLKVEACCPVPFRGSDAPIRRSDPTLRSALTLWLSYSVRFTCTEEYSTIYNYCTIYITVCACVRETCIILYTKGRTVPVAVALFRSIKRDIPSLLVLAVRVEI
jgi:hypothetical protein